MVPLRKSPDCFDWFNPQDLPSFLKYGHRRRQGKPEDWLTIASRTVPRFNDSMKKAKRSDERLVTSARR
jgi:hypothetical protein